jgi:hypothetical protein
MKRKVLFVLFVVGITVMVTAQTWGHGGRGRGWSSTAGTATVSGSVIISHDSPAIKSGNTTYLLGGIGNFIGEIKEGSQVTIEGQVARIDDDVDNVFKFLRPTKLTVDGKSYDFRVSAMGRTWGFRNF